VDHPLHPYIPTHEEALVNFALCCGSQSSPYIKIYHVQNLSTQLLNSAANYLREHVVIDFNKHTLILPKLIQWYEDDMNKQSSTTSNHKDMDKDQSKKKTKLKKQKEHLLERLFDIMCPTQVIQIQRLIIATNASTNANSTESSSTTSSSVAPTVTKSSSEKEDNKNEIVLHDVSGLKIKYAKYDWSMFVYAPPPSTSLRNMTSSAHSTNNYLSGHTHIYPSISSLFFASTATHVNSYSFDRILLEMGVEGIRLLQLLDKARSSLVQGGLLVRNVTIKIKSGFTKKKRVFNNVFKGNEFVSWLVAQLAQSSASSATLFALESEAASMCQQLLDLGAISLAVVSSLISV
jgi:hypothetical protein